MSGSEALFQAPVLSTMMLDSLDMEGYKRALTVSMERGAMRVSRRRRSDWTSCTICSQEEYERDRRLYGWQIEFPALSALRLHREIFRKVRDVPLLDFPVSASQREPLSRELIAIKSIARRWWKANIRRIRKTRGYAMSETLWQVRYIQQSLERSEGDKGWRLTDGEWSQVLRPLMIAKDDVIITGGLNHLLRIFEICYTPESKETREEARRIARVKAAKTRRGRAPVKRQLIIDYLIAHPECKVREVMDACGVSQKYVYQTKKMLEG